MTSLRVRIRTGLVAGLLVLLALQTLLVAHAIRHITENHAVARLEHEVESLLAAVQLRDDTPPTLDSSRVNAFYQRPFSGHYYRIDTPQGALVSRSLWDWTLGLPPAPPGENLRVHARGPQGQSLLVLAQGFSKQGTPIQVAVAEDLSQVNADIRRYQLVQAALSIVLIVLLVAATTWIVRRGLLPLQRTRDELQSLAQGRVSALNERVPEEIRPLVHEINRLLLLTAQRLERSRKSAGNLAHGLKTPLTILSRLSSAPALASAPEVGHTLAAQVERMRGLIARELKRARLAGAGTGARRFDSGRDLPPLVSILEQLYAERHVRISLHVDPDVPAFGDREDLLELFGNLLDNACKWARSRVEVRIRGEHGLTAHIADDGPGVGNSDAETLLQRGNRLDQAEEGHGLGLAIASDIVRQYGGALQLGRSPTLGGLQVDIRIPATDQNPSAA